MQQDQAKEMWANYQRQLRAMLQSSRDARLFHRDVKEMADDKLKQALTDRNINNQGHRIAMEERLLRSEWRKKHPYDDVPWYPEFDELGGGDIPLSRLDCWRISRERQHDRHYARKGDRSPQKRQYREEK